MTREEQRTRRIERGRAIEPLWAQGMSLKEIAATLGRPEDKVMADVGVLRKIGGFDFPYRRTRPILDPEVAAEARRAAVRRGYRRHREKRLTATRERNRRNPQKVVARQAVTNALESGRLVRPDRCSQCGDVPSVAIDGRTTIQAHHADYSRPLEVEWLCASCHSKAHPQNERAIAAARGEVHAARARRRRLDAMERERAVYEDTEERAS